MNNSIKTISNDASVFEIPAERFICPESLTDLTHQVEACLRLALPITMRAGGTSLGGQAIGSGAVIDVSKHLTHILDYRPDEKEVDVEPGVIQDDLNAFVRKDGLRFAPDTSTSNRAMIGGMIGNNSCGSYSVYYGTTREYVKSIEVVLADGSETIFEPLTPQKLREKLELQSFEGNIYRTIFNLLERHGKTILEHYPHPSIKRRNTGYALDELYRHHQPFNPDGRPFNLAPLICGSEGTLAVIKKATLNLVKTPKFQQLICAHFDSVEKAMKVVNHLLEFRPAAIELIDKATLDGTKTNLQQQQNRFWIDGDPLAVLVIELFDEDENSLTKRLIEQQQWLLQNGSYSVPVIDRADSAKIWEVRKAGLGMLMGKVTRKKAVAVIEDAAVPVTSLYDYYQDVRNLMAELGVGCVYYGHASVGLIHIRPELDLATSEGKQLFRTIAERNSTLVKKYRGALSGEHGDGRIRAPFLKEQVGEQVYAWLLELKRAFDPHNLLNPGVILGNVSITENLRADRQPRQSLTTAFDWSGDLSLMDAVEKCNGAGACRKSSGLMCPSYQATREENYSTRGRANLLRHALTEPDPRQALSHPELKDALELCLGCKGCKSQCPANVDMARLKAEVLYQSRKFLDLSRLALKHYGRLMKLGALFPRLFNGIQSLALVKRLMGVDPRRNLPSVRAESLQVWWGKQKPFSDSRAPRIWVLCDLFSQYQEPQVGQAVLNSLQKLGLSVQPLFMAQSPRALISKGLLLEARAALLDVAEQLLEVREEDYLIGIEPSELLVWRDEAKDLLAKAPQSTALEKMPVWRSNIQSFEEFILSYVELEKLPRLRTSPRKVWLHVHCHQKSLAKPLDSQRALQWIEGLQVEMISSGCCGMSGEFGYKHYDVSKTIAEQALLPALQNASDGDWIVATGTSCRHQVADLGGYQALHIAQVFEQVLSAAD
ncbi:FAD-binding and (Fe-S)-binding domain-containing protein [Thiomicrorhabdus heinhorstiae]|uniref:FAD-binding oxidoreductase n=1 Tax=Thiomicrorhabdus heinhorstiae TaxID=2748010 RepID=A0ABS0BXX4_9GAMM|nr:FAD-binding and (Fe-S)-binding domain-containing protein [Thiomicrorhabdus heinhorstiae]MBF6058635.1 FAD-binding oxidoreductase [Thiomicrorhabdus heinhorstiae]